MPKKAFYQKQANTIIKNLDRRGMQGFYCENKEQAVEKALEIMKADTSVAFGGSVTLGEMGLIDVLKEKGYEIIDRTLAKTPEERKEIYGKSVMADYFLMSTNAITLDGQLVNIDGNGNRVACLITGPEHVIVFTGMNKVVTSLEEGINRVHNIAAPPNAVRLGRNTPCGATGVCTECFGEDCMCSHTVITRKSNPKGRIVVVLIGEELGY